MKDRDCLHDVSKGGLKRLKRPVKAQGTSVFRRDLSEAMTLAS